MLKGKFVMGKPIVEQTTREPLGKQIQDSIVVRANRHYSLHSSDYIAGFWVRGVEPDAEFSILPLCAVAEIGKDAIAVDAGSWFAPNASSSIQRYRRYKNEVINRRILTPDGQDLGTASDIYFDPQTGAIEGYEALGGLFADPKTGKSFIPATRIIEVGDRAVGVPSETVERMKERESNALTVSCPPPLSAQKFQKAFAIGKIAREQVCTPNGVPLLVSGQPITAAHAAVAQNLGILEQLYLAAGGDTHETFGGEMLICKMASPLGRAWGRRVRQVVENIDGSIIAAPGQIVTEREIARAIEFHQERDLLAAVGCSLEDDLDLQELCDTCRFLDSCQIVSGWKAAVSRDDSDPSAPLQMPVVGARGEMSQSEQIQNALGRPVMKEIRDRDERLIIEVGDLITYHAVQQAIQAEMLAKLLGSVYES